MWPSGLSQAAVKYSSTPYRLGASGIGILVDGQTGPCMVWCMDGMLGGGGIIVLLSSTMFKHSCRAEDPDLNPAWVMNVHSAANVNKWDDQSKIQIETSCNLWQNYYITKSIKTRLTYKFRILFLKYKLIYDEINISKSNPQNWIPISRSLQSELFYVCN